MSDKRSKGVLGADVLGGALCIGGFFLALLVVLAMFKGLPDAGATGTGGIARRVILAFGHAPALVLSLGVTAVGARIFLGGLYDRMPRDLSGLLGTSAGLAILLGTFSETAGGGLGAATGGFLAGALTTVPAAILGLAAVVAPIWLTWLREVELRNPKNRHLDPLLAVAREGDVESAPEASVSPQEAEALLPDVDGEAEPDAEEEEDAPPHQLEVEEILAGETPAWVLQDESTNPYPDDPRLKGEIPAGARPLETEDARITRSQAASSSRWTPDRDPDTVESPDDDLAVGEFRPQEHVGATRTEADAESEDGIVSAEQHAAAGAGGGADQGEDLGGEAVTGGVSVLRVDSNALRPSWESETVEASEEEPVAPEGPTGSSQVWRPGQETAELEEEEEYEEEEVEEEGPSEAAAELEEEEEYEEEEVEEEEPSEAAAELEEEEEYEEEEVEEEEPSEAAAELEEEEEYEEYEEEEVEEEEPSEAAAELEEEEESEEDEEEEYEYVEVAEGEEGPGDDEEWEYEYVEVEEDEEEELVASAEDAEAEDAEAEDAEELAAAETAGEEATAEAEVETEEVVEPVTAAPPDPEPVEASQAEEEPDEVQMDLFADPEVAAAAAEEPVVVLEPQEPPALAASDRARLAAELILDESRVAVSLLQRKFGLDFSESCVVLDELQELGFIGPYVDGKQRDILMDREEWLSAVGSE